MPFAAQRHSLDFSLPRISYFKVTIYGYSGLQSFVIVLPINFFFVTSTNRHRKGKRNFNFCPTVDFRRLRVFSHALSEPVEFNFHLPYFHSTLIATVHVPELKRVAGFISACHHLLVRCMASPYYRIWYCITLPVIQITTSRGSEISMHLQRASEPEWTSTGRRGWIWNPKMLVSYTRTSLQRQCYM